MENDNKNARPLWFVMLVLLSVLPIAVWMYAFQKLNGELEGTAMCVLKRFPGEACGMLGMAGYVWATRREVSNVLIAVVWLSYIALGAMAAIY